MHKTRFHAASLGFIGLMLALSPAMASDDSAPGVKSMGEQVRDAVAGGAKSNQRVTLVINGKEKKFITIPDGKPVAPGEASQPNTDGGQAGAPAAVRPVAVATAAPKRAVQAVNPQASRHYIRAKAAALVGHQAPHDDVHWSYEGENGPQAWGQLKPEFNLCATGKRQSPINIDESLTLQGPAEPLQFNYQPSSASVVNNGHTIQVDLQGDNSVTVRGSSYQLLQFHFHAPSEEKVNDQGFAMVAHLVHKNAEGQLAVVSVLLQAGAANALIHKVWTYMPLDTHDRVGIPAGLIDMNELLPADQLYYQFMGSLTTPPCTEGVLWLVLKQPSAVSPAQIRLFTQLFPHNARPLQSANGRPVRDAQ